MVIEDDEASGLTNTSAEQGVERGETNVSQGNLPPSSGSLPGSGAGKEEPSAGEPETDFPPETESQGMQVKEPIQPVGVASQPEAEGTHPPTALGGGMGAADPILRDQEMPPQPSLPTEEIEKPSATAMRGAPLFSPEAFTLPGPTEALAGQAAPTQAEEQMPRKSMLKLLVSDQDMADLWERADKARADIQAEVDTLQIGRSLLDLLKSFRNEILGGKDRYEYAERYLNEVEYRVAVLRRVKRWSNRLGMVLFLYEMAWAVVILLGLFLGLGAAAFDPGASNIIYLAGSMAWGGLGGVIGALYALVKHISLDQDFDGQHRMWYFNSPLMGVGVGVVVYAVVRAGLLSISGPDQPIGSPFIIYVTAWLAGYQHNVFTDIIRRILKVFKIDENGTEREAGGVEASQAVPGVPPASQFQGEQMPAGEPGVETSG
jgi:hypothetical protein